jgi:competence CoiA-like predicted nuclease
MQVALLGNTQVLAYNSKDSYGNWNVDYTEKLKQASQRKDIRCVECGTIVYFAAGSKKKPYFFHSNLPEECEYEKNYSKYSKEYIDGIQILYEWLTNCCGEGHVAVDRRFSDSKHRSPIMVDYTKNIFSFEFFRQERNIDDYQDKNKLYNEEGIKVYNVLSNERLKESKDAQSRFWTMFIEKYTHNGLLIFFSVKDRSFIYRKYLRNDNNSIVKPFDKEYKLSGLNFSKDGLDFEPFEKEYKEARKAFLKKYNRAVKEDLVSETEEREELIYGASPIISKSGFLRIIEGLKNKRISINDAYILMECVQDYGIIQQIYDGPSKNELNKMINLTLGRVDPSKLRDLLVDIQFML